MKNMEETVKYLKEQIKRYASLEEEYAQKEQDALFVNNNVAVEAARSWKSFYFLVKQEFLKAYEDITGEDRFRLLMELLKEV